MSEMKLETFLLKVSDYVRIRLNVYLPNKESTRTNGIIMIKILNVEIEDL